jgi:hypothetical protein
VATMTTQISMLLPSPPLLPPSTGHHLNSRATGPSAMISAFLGHLNHSRNSAQDARVREHGNAWEAESKMSTADRVAPLKAAFGTSMRFQTQLRIVADNTASQALPCSRRANPL